MLNLLLCHWSKQLSDLRAPSSTHVPVLLLQPSVVVAKTSYQMLEIVSFSDRGEGLTSFNRNKCTSSYGEKKSTVKLSKVSIFREYARVKCPPR